jgi:hypothetical protein
MAGISDALSIGSQVSLQRHALARSTEFMVIFAGNACFHQMRKPRGSN